MVSRYLLRYWSRCDRTISTRLNTIILLFFPKYVSDRTIHTWKYIYSWYPNGASKNWSVHLCKYHLRVKSRGEGQGGVSGTLERAQSSGTITSASGPPTIFSPQKRAHMDLLNLNIPCLHVFVFFNSFGNKVNTTKKKLTWIHQNRRRRVVSTFLFRKLPHFMSSYPLLYPFLTKNCWGH